jgi:hypothetical protein
MNEGLGLGQIDEVMLQRGLTEPGQVETRSELRLTLADRAKQVWVRADFAKENSMALTSVQVADLKRICLRHVSCDRESFQSWNVPF